MIESQIFEISSYSTGKRYSIRFMDMEGGNVEGLERDDIEFNHPTAATQQVKRMDQEQIPSFYKGLIGDSFNYRYQKILRKYLS